MEDKEEKWAEKKEDPFFLPTFINVQLFLSLSLDATSKERPFSGVGVGGGGRKLRDFKACAIDTFRTFRLGKEEKIKGERKEGVGALMPRRCRCLYILHENAEKRM